MHMIKFNFDAQSSSQTHFLDANFHQKKIKNNFNGYASVAQPYKPQTNPKQLNLEQPHLDVLHSYASVIQAHTTAQHLNVTTVTQDASEQRLALEHFIRDKYQKVHQGIHKYFFRYLVCRLCKPRHASGDWHATIRRKAKPFWKQYLRRTH